MSPDFQIEVACPACGHSLTVNATPVCYAALDAFLAQHRECNQVPAEASA